MKKDAISTGLFIAIGFLCVAIVIAILVPLVRTIIDETDDNKPTIPGVTLTQPLNSNQPTAALCMTHPLV